MIQRFENVLPEHICRGALASFPPENWPWWHRYESGKRATVDPTRIPAGCMLALSTLAQISPPAGFWDFDMYGAGLHLMPTGTKLGRHFDATHHPQRPWRRLFSLVCFLTGGNGGELTIETGTGPKTIHPAPNTAVLFPAALWHSVSETQADRKTLSLFCWETTDEPKQSISATFQKAVT